MNEALVPHAQRLKIADVPEIYMQEFWATATVHHHAIRFKMDNKKHIMNLESFRDMLHICPRVHGQSFDEAPFKEEILAFIHFLGHSPRLTTTQKGKQTAKTSKAKSLTTLSEVAMTKAQQLKLVTKRSLQQTHISQASGFGADEGTGLPGVPDVPTDESNKELSWNSTDDEGADDEGKGDIGLNIGEEERHVEEEEENELYRDVNINQGRGIQATLEVEDFHVTLTLVNPNDQWMNEAVKVAIQIQFDRLHDEAQRENDKFLKIVDENINKIINEQVKEQVKTSYVVVADLSEMELKKILIEKMEGNKSIQCLDEQRNLYKALVEAYESNKIILDTYGETITLKRRQDDDADKDKEPSARPDRGSKRSIEGKEPESASAPMETATRSAGSLVNLEYHLEEVFKATTDQLDWVNPEGQQYPYNLLQPLPLIPNNRGRRVILFVHFINNDLECLCGGVSHWGRKRQQFYGFTVNWESARDVYSKRRIIVVTELKIVEWHSYKHLDWITVRRDDDKFYKFKEGDFKRLLIQDIEDMLLLRRRVEDLQLGVKSYQKKLILTKPDTYQSDLKHKEAYIAYSNQRGFIYQNKDKKTDDRLKGIQMQYLPQSIWRKSDKDRATAMIQAIDKRLKTRRIVDPNTQI
nr:hypothetical protein [Tanacetum cinerariifolium]